MIDGTKFSSWKDFALYVMEELDVAHDEVDTLKRSYQDLRDDFKEFKTRVYTVAAIVILILGAIEITFRV